MVFFVYPSNTQYDDEIKAWIDAIYLNFSVLSIIYNLDSSLFGVNLD